MAARALKPDGRTGEPIPVAFTADRREIAGIRREDRGIGARLDPPPAQPLSTGRIRATRSTPAYRHISATGTPRDLKQIR